MTWPRRRERRAITRALRREAELCSTPLEAQESRNALAVLTHRRDERGWAKCASGTFERSEYAKTTTNPWRVTCPVCNDVVRREVTSWPVGSPLYAPDRGGFYGEAVYAVTEWSDTVGIMISSEVS